ncbi:MAG: HEAT repeat domain-containing protein [Planctomycetota bacterium]
MMRQTLVAGLVVAALGVGLYVALPARNAPERLPPGASERVWINPVYLTEPPPGVRRGGLKRPLTERLVDRVGWATSEVQNYSLRQLQGQPDAASCVAGRLEELLPSRSLEIFHAARLLEFLGQAHEAAYVDLMIRCLEHPSRAIPLAAIKALAEVGTEAARAKLLELTRSADLPLRDAAIAAFTGDTLAPQAQLELLLAHPPRGLQGIIEGLAAKGYTAAIEPIAAYLDDPSFAVRVAAARALAVLKDPRGRGVATLIALLRSGVVDEQLAAVRALTVARVLPAADECEPLFSSASADVRALAAEMVAAGQPETEAARQQKGRLLEQLAEDATSRVRRVAIQGLYAMGRTDVALPLVDDVRERHGGELMEAVQVLSEQLKDPRGLVALRERITRPADAYDRSALLHGLAQYGDAESVRFFVADLERAGGADDPRIGERENAILLSYQAAVKVQGLGRAAVEALLSELAARPRAAVALLCLDALRGALTRFGAAADRDVAERAAGALATLIEDEQIDVAVRLAAVDTFPYLGDSSLAEPLQAALAHVRNIDVCKRIDLVLWNYF